jgi:hypothetical protein
MNDKSPKTTLPGNLNKSEFDLLLESMPSLTKKEELELRKKRIELLRQEKIRNKKKKDIDRTEEYFDFKEGKKDESYKVMEAAKGGEVKKYMGGGSVRKNKSNMITKRGWGASRKT